MDKIADAFSLIRNGANIKQGLDDSGYPITRIETISNRTVDRDKMGYAGITDITKYSDYVLQDGDILMSHINSETHLGKVARYEKYEGETIIHGMNLLCLRPNKNLVDSRYAFYYLSSEAFLHQIPRITKKSVNQASFNVAALKELTFPISSMEVQQPVADILDKANELIALRKEQLAKLDELIKARFVELFGDPLKNEKCLPMVSGEALFKLSNGKTLPNNKRFDTGVPAYGGNGISWYTNEILCNYDTIIVGRVGFQSGNVHLVKAPLWVTDNAMYISNINSRKCDIRYLCALMERIDFTRYQDAGDLKKITQKPFMQMHYLMPPLPLQKQYIAFVEQVNKSKVAVQKALDEAQLLFDSLMQKYFG